MLWTSCWLGRLPSIANSNAWLILKNAHAVDQLLAWLIASKCQRCGPAVGLAVCV